MQGDRDEVLEKIPNTVAETPGEEENTKVIAPILSFQVNTDGLISAFFQRTKTGSSKLNSFKSYDIFTAKRTKEETQKSIYAPDCSKGKQVFFIFFMFFFNMLTVVIQ